MNALFKELLLRVFVSGVLCSLALILAGNGPHKEPVRLCCVALTLVVLIKPYSHNVPDIAAVLRSGEVISEMIESNKLNPADWLVVKDTPSEMVLIHRHFDSKTKVIPKGEVV